VFSTDTILTAFRNNVIWVLIFPFFVTTIGLIFAVLTERIRWATAFKALVVMPIVFSTTASALVWATMLDNSPQIGVVNAAVLTVSDWFNPPGAYPVSASAGQTVAELVGSNAHAEKNSGIVSNSSARAGGTINIGLEDVSPTTPGSPQGPSRGGSRSRCRAPSLVSSGARFHRVIRRIRPMSCPGVGPSDTSPLVGELSGRERSDDNDDDEWPVQIFRCRNGSYFVELAGSNFSSALPVFRGSVAFTDARFWLGQTAQALLSVPLADMAMIITYL